MNKKELIRRAALSMREKNIRKSVSIPKHAFRISDDDGNTRVFHVKQTDKSVLFTADDIEAMLDICISVIEDALRAGEDVSIQGFGRFYLKYRKPKIVINNMDGGKEMWSKGKYVPVFFVGTDLVRCGQMYEQSLEDKKINEPLPIFAEEEDEGEE